MPNIQEGVPNSGPHPQVHTYLPQPQSSEPLCPSGLGALTFLLCTEGASCRESVRRVARVLASWHWASAAEGFNDQVEVTEGIINKTPAIIDYHLRGNVSAPFNLHVSRFSETDAQSRWKNLTSYHPGGRPPLTGPIMSPNFQQPTKPSQFSSSCSSGNVVPLLESLFGEGWKLRDAPRTCFRGTVPGGSDLHVPRPRSNDDAPIPPSNPTCAACAYQNAREWPYIRLKELKGQESEAFPGISGRH